MKDGTGLKIMTGTAIILALAACIGTFIQYNTGTRLSAQLAAAEADSQKLRDQLVAANAQTAVLDEKVAQEQQILVREARPDLPIKLTFRSALLGQGKVAVIQNISSRELEIVLDVVSPATGGEFHRSLVIEANRVQEIGSSQGWTFATGQQVKLTNPLFRPIAGTIRG